MNDFEKPSLHQDFWQKLKSFTDARIGLGHTGGSLTTKHHLAFQFAHAQAQDAVWRKLDWQAIEQQLTDLSLDFMRIQSKAGNRDEYLQRPDFGRQLSEDSKTTLLALNARFDVAIVVADGLSSTAIEQNAIAFIKQLIPSLESQQLSIGPIVLAEQARVALGDPIAEVLQAKHLIVLVGERPGLSSPNSLGLYYTFNAQSGHTDAQRNCISNVREGGQSTEQAVNRLMWLLNEADKRQLSGVQLKDDSQGEMQAIELTKNFLLPNR